MKPVLLALAFVVAPVALAGPAFGHATVDPAAGAAGTNVRIVVAVPDEEDAPGIVTTKVVIEAPETFSMVGCTGEAPWTCTVTEERIATFERPASAAQDGDKPGLPIEVRTASSAGSYPIEVNQFYSSGEVVNWDGPPGSDKPAASFEVTGSAPEVTTGPAPTTEVTTGSTSTSTTSGDGSPAAQPEDADDVEGEEPTSDNDFPWWVVILGGAALLVGIGAATIGRRRP